MNTDNKKDKLITQLIRDTLNDVIEWSIATTPTPLTHATEDYVPLYLETIFNNKRIGIYELRYRHFTDYDEFYWAEKIGICIVVDPDVVIWKIEEYSPALRDLLNLAREQASGLSDFFDKI